MVMNFKAQSFDDIFPIMGMKDGMLISRRGDVTVGWELELPEAYSLDEDGYDEMQASFASAVRLLPPWTMVHRQDIFAEGRYHAELKDSFLGQAYEDHFEGRTYLRHRSFIFLTTSVKSSALRSVSATGLLARSSATAKTVEEQVSSLVAKSSEFISVLCGNGVIGARMLTDDDYADEYNNGIIPDCLRLWSDDGIMSDFPMDGRSVDVGGRRIWAYTIGEASQLPGNVETTRRVEQLSTVGTELRLSLSAPIGPMLDCEHTVNQYILTAPQQDVLSALDATRRRAESMSKRSAENRVNAQEIQEFIESAHSESRTAVYTHLNIMVWGRPDEESDRRARISTALAGMGVTCVQDTYDMPVLWFASIPGAACELGKENLMLSELSSVLSLGIYETYSKGLESGILKFCDRSRHIPVTVDMQQAALDAGLISNYNAFIIGGSGTGKSFFTNYLVRSCYDAGETVFILDVGDSYEGLCSVIRDESGGGDGQYYKWDGAHPLSFDAFRDYDQWLDSGGRLSQDNASLDFLLSFMMTLWSPDGGWTSDTVPILRKIVTEFILSWKGRDERPVFDDLRNYMDGTVAPQIKSEAGYICNGRSVKESWFNIDRFLVAIGEYSLGGPYEFLLNDRSPRDLASSRFTVFEVDEISNAPDRTFYSLVILCIMHTFDSRMRRSGGFKVMVIEEAWKAIANETMAPYLSGLWKTSRKYQTSAMVVTQQISDVVSSAIVKDTIVANSSIRALLEHTGGQSSFRQISDLLGLSRRQECLAMSVGKGIDHRYGNYREVFVALGDTFSGVFSNEVSEEEAVGYESNKEKKQPLLALEEAMGIREAISRLARKAREGRS